jgi:hypothetical protein
LWKKRFLHLFHQVLVNAHILHNQSRRKICQWKIFNEKVAKVLLTSDDTEIQVQGQTSRPAGRLVGRDHFVYSIPATHAKLEGNSQLSFLVSAEKQVPDQETVKTCTTTYCRKCYAGLCVGQCFDLNPTKTNYWE